MKKTQIFALFLVFISFFAVFSVGTKSYAEDVNLVDIKSEALKDYFSPVHFTFGGNNFPGGFIRTPALNNSMKITDSDGNKRNCRKQLAGFYYNAVRGNRLRPLDQETLNTLKAGDSSYAGLTMEGGVYTDCDEDPYGRYGQIKYTYKGVVSYLIIGTEYNYTNSIYTPKLAYSFTNYENTTPIGYIYDTVGGMGFVGGQLNLACHQYVINDIDNGKTVDEAIIRQNDNSLIAKNHPECAINFEYTGGALETMRSISVAGNTSLSKSLDKYDRRNIKGNLKDKSLVQTTNITIGKITQSLRKKSESLCRGKKNQAGQVIDYSEDVICVLFDNYTTSNKVNINLSSDNFNGKTVVVRNGDVVLKGKNPITKYLDIFIDKGNLLLDNNTSPTQKFDKKGYPNMAGNTAGILLQGNIIVNGLVLGYDGTDIVPYSHKLFLHGRLASLNTPTDPKLGRVNQVEKIPAAVNYTGFINLQNVFVRKCNPMTNKGSDNINCGNNDGSNFMVPLYVIDSKYYSRLLK